MKLKKPYEPTRKRMELMMEGKTGKRKTVKITLNQNRSNRIKKSDIKTSITTSSSWLISFIWGRLIRNLKAGHLLKIGVLKYMTGQRKW
jgi:hypothetical protein